MELGLQGRCVIVTGASGQIGRATAATFADEGAQVVLTYHNRQQPAEQVAAEIAAKGGRALSLPLDLSDASSVVELVGAVQRQVGHIDVLVNNAVAWPERGAAEELFEQAPLDRLQRSVAANLVGYYALSQAVVGPMRARTWGRIVHLSTGLVEDGFPRSSAYTTAKAGLHGLTRTMSRELAASGILTNLVMAGFVPRAGFPPEVIERTSRAAAIGRTSEANEIANLIVFLSSAANTNITGERIRADGHFLSRT